MSRFKVSAKALVLAASMLTPPALAAPVPLSDAQLGAVSAGARFTITNRVSDQNGVAPVTDPHLINPWGLSQGPGTFLWTSNNGDPNGSTTTTGSSTLYDTTNGFQKQALVVSVPGGPTGTVFVNLANRFNVAENGKSGNTQFAFATEGGTILGWNFTVDPNNAIVAVDQSKSGSIFKGLTLGMDGKKPLLFAADFGRGVIDVYNSSFKQVRTFTDPYLPPNYTPFNVQSLNGKLYVTFVLRQPGAGDETAGPGLGIVDVFDTDGHLLQRLAKGGSLNAPWGLAIAPASFGRFAGDLLVGNFGDGKISVFDPRSGHFLGQLSMPKHQGKVDIDGLWALQTGPGGSIVFSAGPQDESHGLVGTIAAATPMWAHHEVAMPMEMHH